ncbi:MAG: PEGA domain-containing protein [Myxococcaceae bacterium]|nr:PEGA domain-containing protein [Myxococcaceae bacterium]
MSNHSRASQRLVAASTLLLFTVGCASTTIIRSEPSGATVYVDGSKAGTTPYTYSDTKIVGSSTRIKLKKEGYEDLETIITRSEQFEVGPCIGGVFFLVPFLWVMGYQPDHNYELSPLSSQVQQSPAAAPGSI